MDKAPRYQSPETIAVRQMLWTAGISFAIGATLVLLGVLWLTFFGDGRPTRWWEWGLTILQSLHWISVGGLAACALACSVLSRRQFSKGYHRCPYCGGPRRGIGIPCPCGGALAAPLPDSFERSYRDSSNQESSIRRD